MDEDKIMIGAIYERVRFPHPNLWIHISKDWDFEGYTEYWVTIRVLFPYQVVFKGTRYRGKNTIMRHKHGVWESVLQTAFRKIDEKREAPAKWWWPL